jgi:hypothetical protein
MLLFQIKNAYNKKGNVLAAERKKKANFKKNYIMKAHYLEAFF